MIESLTPKKYIFRLGQTASSYDITCNKEPLEWEEGIIEVNRKLEAGGVFTTFSVSSLTFVGNGAKFLLDIFESDEINAQAYLFVYYFDVKTRLYVQLPGVFQAKFASFKIKKVGNFAFGVNIEFIRTGGYQKLIDRQGLDIDISKNTTVGGMILEQYPNIDEISKLSFPELKSSLYAKNTARGVYKNSSFYFQYALVEGYNSIPISVINSDFAETKRVLFESGQANVSDLSPFFDNSTAPRDMLITYDIYVRVDNGFYFHEHALALRYAIKHEGVFTEYATPTAPFGKYDALRRLNGSFSISIELGDEVYLFIKQTANDGIAHICRPTFSNPESEYATTITISQQIVNTAAVTVDGLPVYEAVERASQIILDSNYPIYSEFFGRTDSKFTAAKMYEAENANRFAHICSGVNLRGLTISDEQGKINTKWEDLIKALSCCYNIGYGFETIEGSERIRIEERNYFFDDTTGIDLSDRITELDIEKEYMPDLAYVQVDCGYENNTFRSVNGRGEYNTKQTRSLEISADQKLDLISPLRADTIGIVNCLEMPINLKGSEDIDEDEKVFIIKTQRDGTGWKVESNEIITIENDSSLFKTGSLNLYFSPLRNLIRNRDHLTCAMQKQLSSMIRFQTSGKLSNLETSGEGYSFNVKENEDLTINQLNEISAPKIKPIKLIFTSLFTRADLEYLFSTGEDGKLNMYRKIKLTPTISGYVLNIKKKNDEDKATIELIQAL
jgi:hypothetical protein